MAITGSERYQLARTLSIATIVVLVLRAAPAVVAALAPEPSGTARIPVGYNPKDFLAYIAFIREASDTGTWWLANPFTTAPQSDRFLTLYFSVVGLVCRVTGLDPFVALELSRIPSCALFFAALGSLVREVLPDRTTRVWAVWLVALSGGFGFLARSMAPLLPDALANPVFQNLWTAYGWSTFESFYNPMWALGLAITLAVLAVCLRPEGPRGWGEMVRVNLGFVLLYAVHPYSAIVVFSVVVVRIVRELRSGGASGRRRADRLSASLVPALTAVAAIALFQLGDAVFRASAGGVVGPQFVSLLWYPIGLGLVGWLAWKGLEHSRRGNEAWPREIVCWATTVAVLHALPGLNGYHFLFHLHVPLVLLAAPAAAIAFGAAGPLRRAWLILALFLSSVAVTVEATREVVHGNLVPRSSIETAQVLGTRPPGNVLAPPSVGGLIPAWGPHRVWVGQWYLSPSTQERTLVVEEMFEAPGAHAPSIRALVSRERIRYVVAPTGRADDMMAVLGAAVVERDDLGALVLLTLREWPGAAH